MFIYRIGPFMAQKANYAIVVATSEKEAESPLYRYSYYMREAKVEKIGTAEPHMKPGILAFMSVDGWNNDIFGM